MRLSRISLALSLAGLGLADIKFSSPAAGSSHIGGGSLQIQWSDSGTAPVLSDLTTYQLFLCAGGSDPGSFIELTDITTNGIFANGNQAEGTVSADLGDSTKNAYFLKMISVAAEGGTVINYSSRFTMTGMTGIFPANVQTALASLSGTDGPPTENDVAKAGAAGTQTGAVGSFAVPFAMQTGPIRYAPMQNSVPTKITKKTKTPLNPTSPYTIATTFLPPAKSIISTATAPVTWSFSQMENTVAAASMPADDMQRFLARWKD